MPKRIQLRRAKGWRLPPDAVKVDRSTPWGNPFVVGKDGTRDDCVELYRILLARGFLCLTCNTGIDAQRDAREHIVHHHKELRGKDLACWCPLDQPCHADVLLELANA